MANFLYLCTLYHSPPQGRDALVVHLLNRKRNSTQQTPTRIMKKKLLYLLIILTIIGAILAAQQYYLAYVNNLKSNDGEPHLIYIYPETTLSELHDKISLTHTIQSHWSWELHCRLLSFTRPKAGCYELLPEEGSIAVIRRLRGGMQTPVRVTLNNIRTPEQLAARLANQLMLDSTSIITRLGDNDFLKQYNLKKETAVSLFIPNSYELFWTISPDQLFRRMHQEYKAFWTSEREAKAKQLKLTKAEVATIASICEEESNNAAEYPIIAGLYLNRIKKGMPLQACPTVKFALRDFTIRRVLTRHLQFDSPYNTYKYPGLPPGPIRIPKATTMDAVLNRTPHNYLYMCASADFNGTHHFSSTYAEHARYARIYQKALNQRGIR